MLSRRLICLILFLAAAPAIALEALPVTLIEAVSRDVEVAAEAPGDLESLAQPKVAAELAGRLLSLSVDEGAAVSAGQILAEIDAETYRLALQQAQAEQARLQAQIKNQQLTLDRFRNLVKQNSTAQSDLDKAATDLAVFQAQLAGAQASMADARYRLSKSLVHSPAAGVIQQRFVSVGDYVQPGAPLFQVVATTPLRARLYFPESLAARIQPGQAVKLSLPGQAEEPAAATISALRPMLNPANRSLEALAEFPNPGGWKPGSSVMARIVLEIRSGAVLVPEAALARRPAGMVVYRLENNQARAQVVETGLRDGKLIEIRSGLKAGESIVFDGAGFLSDGAAVHVTSQGKLP
jgi:RND family efflux transporter MFP subunit